jgi:tetrapyrrole methylase family protein / MazG family protein
MVGRITVVGLGPARSDLIVPAADRVIRQSTRRFVRTARHPAVDDLAADGVLFESFDGFYDAGGDLETVYGLIVEALVEAASEGVDIVYAVPGNPVVAERTVVLLRERVADLVIVPGLSFADLAWAHVGVDPLAGARVVDARAFDTQIAGQAGALLIAQTDSVFVLSDVKLALLESLDGDHEVVVLQRLGLADESVVRIALHELDRVVQPDHLTSVFVHTGSVEIAGEFARLWQLTLRLRGPGGCPWDAKQTHHSLARHTLEEAYEVVEAIDRLPIDAPLGDEEIDFDDYAKLEDELGDLLFQVMIHSALAVEAGAFSAADVAATVHDKLVHRHPHVFGDATVESADDVVSNWETIKKAEAKSDSLVDGLPSALPALLYTPKLYRKMNVVGIDPAASAPEQWLASASANIATAGRHEMGNAIGEVLGAIVAVARAHEVDPEAALRGFASRLRDDVRFLENQAQADGVALESLDVEIVQQRWRARRSTATPAPN